MKTITQIIYFSPTGTTRKIAEKIATGIGAKKTTTYDLTLPEGKCDISLTQGTAIFAVPVYAGRVPAIVLDRIAGLKGEGNPAVLVAVYGNRAFEDALVELEDIVTERGFQVCAAGAFIGEHSYATDDYPIANSRPNTDDLEQAVAFGRSIAKKIQNKDAAAPQIAGNRPYRNRPDLGGIAPETVASDCILCGKCVNSCPTGAISMEKTIETNAANCIMCCACVKNCPTGARIFTHPGVQEKRVLLTNNCSEPKQPELFL
jgi:ferredoxin